MPGDKAMHRLMPLLRFLPVLLVLLASCETRPSASRARRPPSVVFQPEKLLEIDAAITAAIAAGQTPGGVLWLEHDGVAYHRAYGRRAVFPNPEGMTEDTIFDAASLTKVLATAPAVLVLVERGRIGLDDPVRRYLPEFAGGGKEAITVRQLLTHTSGLPPGISSAGGWEGVEAAVRLACAAEVRTPPGTAFGYSDVNFILLGEIVRRVSGLPLQEFAARELYRPLKMTQTGFLPPASQRPRIAPTTREGDGVLRGVVHDPTARRMGGVAGHAGLFTTAADVARFARMMLNGGRLEGVRLFRPETIRLMTSVQTPESVRERRGLGWDIDSPYAGPRGVHFPIGSYGHTGWTGTSLWIDPFSRTFVIFLANRNHPSEDGTVIALRRRLGTLAAEAVKGFNFAYVPGALPPRRSGAASEPAAAAPAHEVLNGIDVLVKQNFAPLRGLRLGLITNPTGHDRHRRSTIDLLRHAPGVELKALFSPEHGLRAERDERVEDSVDAATGLPVFSLYGDRRAPAPEQLAELDALVFDLQDVGCRFYTYISTMGLAMEAAAKAGKKFFVLDRVNPINGVTIDGPVLTGQTSFTAFHPLPVRHGMTVGELARMFNAERGWACDLTVIPLEGWSREWWLDETGLPWTNPSPNLRGLTPAALYPGVGLLETTALSVGRGTDTPFELIGAPYIDDVQLAAELNRAGLPGVRFVPVRFTPKASVYQGRPCAGVNLVLTDRAACRVVDIALTIAATLHRLYPAHFDLDRFDRLLGHAATIEALRAGRPLAEIRETWSAELERFRQRRERYLLYR
jgi:uncharacterized protein YbbC (DUF1343 family)/CubicO group peptidase (beta-lactamase class C family)